MCDSPESQGMVIPGNQSNHWGKTKPGDWENPAGLSSLLTLPEFQAPISTQATAFRGGLEMAGHKPHFLCNSARWALPAPGLFLPLFPYVLEDWKHASQHKASGYLPVGRSGSPEKPAASLAGLRSAGMLLLGSHQVNSSSSCYCLSVACCFQTPVGI